MSRDVHSYSVVAFAKLRKKAEVRRKKKLQSKGGRAARRGTAERAIARGHKYWSSLTVVYLPERFLNATSLIFDFVALRAEGIFSCSFLRVLSSMVPA